MLRYLLLIAFFGTLFANAQESKRYTDPYALYKDAYELFEKEKYASARVLFDQYLKEHPYPLDQYLEKASFYRASCAYQLFNKDAHALLDRFVDEYPGSNYIPQVRFMLGNLNFSSKDYEEALRNLNRLRID